MNFVYKKRSMLNFKESVAKVKSAPNFGKVRKTSIQTSITKNVIFFFFAFLESTPGGKSTLGVCGIAQTIEICSTPFSYVYIYIYIHIYVYVYICYVHIILPSVA